MRLKWGLNGSLNLMPFGNSEIAESSDFKVQRPLDRFVAQETWPAAHRLAKCPWAAPRAPFGGDAPAHGCVDALQELILLAVRHQVVEEAQHEPHRLD